MASSMLSNAAVATTMVSRNTGAQASMVAPFTGLKSISTFPVTKKSGNELSSLPSNGGRVQCMQNLMAQTPQINSAKIKVRINSGQREYNQDTKTSLHLSNLLASAEFLAAAKNRIDPSSPTPFHDRKHPPIYFTRKNQHRTVDHLRDRRAQLAKN